MSTHDWRVCKKNSLNLDSLYVPVYWLESVYITGTVACLCQHSSVLEEDSGKAPADFEMKESYDWLHETEQNIHKPPRPRNNPACCFICLWGVMENLNFSWTVMCTHFLSPSRHPQPRPSMMSIWTKGTNCEPSTNLQPGLSCYSLMASRQWRRDSKPT